MRKWARRRERAELDRRWTAGHHAKVGAEAVALVLALVACDRSAPYVAVEPVAVVARAAADGAGAGDPFDASVPEDASRAQEKDVPLSPSRALSGGGLWVADAKGEPVGVLVARGHPALSTGGKPDILRDGVLVYSPKAGLFFGLQMSTGKVLAPRLGVSDASCKTPIVAGYYTDGTDVSGFDQAFVYNGKWWRIEGGQPLTLTSCGGTVAEGADSACSAHSGSCRGFPAKAIAPPLPVAFEAPMAHVWLTP